MELIERQLTSFCTARKAIVSGREQDNRVERHEHIVKCVADLVVLERGACHRLITANIEFKVEFKFDNDEFERFLSNFSEKCQKHGDDVTLFAGELICSVLKVHAADLRKNRAGLAKGAEPPPFIYFRTEFRQFSKKKFPLFFEFFTDFL